LGDRTAAQASRRLADSTQERSAHPLQIAEAGSAGPYRQGVVCGPEHVARGLEPHLLDRARRRLAGLQLERAAELPRPCPL
jgi:hypothetical protein